MRVVVADDVMLTRAGIARLLGDAGIHVVGEAADADSLLREVASKRPDVAVIDIRMPPTHTDEGLVAARAIRAEHPDVGVLVLSQYVEPLFAMRLIEDHPERCGYLLKERVFDVAILVDALRRVGEGDTVIDPTIVSRLVGSKHRQGPLAALTPREQEVLAMVAEGLSNRRSPNASTAANAPSKPTSPRSSSNFSFPTLPTGIAACRPSSPTCARNGGNACDQGTTREYPGGDRCRSVRRWRHEHHH